MPPSGMLEARPVPKPPQPAQGKPGLAPGPPRPRLASATWGLDAANTRASRANLPALPPRLPFPFAVAMRRVIANGYTRRMLQADLMAGAVVAIVALPLSMALSIAVGAPPQHGLYTAIVAGFVVALAGGSKHQVTGSTAAFVVVLAP